MKKNFIYASMALVLYVFSSFQVNGQDYILSQPFNNSLTIAPSFAGMTSGGRVAFSYRNQWPNINSFKAFNTYAFGIDFYLPNYNSGIGALISSDVQGSGLLRSIDAGLQYNYRVRINRDLYFRPGVQLKVVHKELDYTKLIFSENIGIDGTVISNTTPFDVDYDSYTKLDASFSSLFYNKYFWAGFNIDHLIPYNSSFLNQDSKIPMKFVLTGGFNWIYKENRFGNEPDEVITFATLLQHQKEFNQMDIGATWTKSFLQLGLWYRGFITPVSTITARDALILIAGLNLPEFKISYSYDVSLSSLYDSSAGSHEISLIYFFARRERSPMSFFCR